VNETQPMRRADTEDHRATMRWGILTVVLLLIQGGCCGFGRQDFSAPVEGVNVYFDKTASGKVRKVAILPFKAPTDLIGTSVSDMFVTELLKSKTYRLVERSQISRVLNEAELALSGISNAKAMEVGQMSGADGVMIGTVSEYELTAYKGHKFPSVGISVRLIDSQSGEIVWSADYAERSHEKGMALSEQARNVVHAISSTLYHAGMRDR
jgi:curli biogenesis system outer membrane secretion channel CsgG